MSLEVFIASATNVPNVEKFGKSDPYAQVEFQGVKKKTEVHKGDLNPTFNENLVFDLHGQPLQSQDELKVYIKDWEMVGRNRLLATTTVALKELIRPGASRNKKLSLNLKDSSQRPIETVLIITLTYKPPPGAEPSGGGGVNQEIGQEVTIEDEDEEEDDYDAVDGAEDAPDGAPGAKPRKRKKKKRLGNRKVRSNLSNKAQDFQIRVKIVEARQLPGANISPVSRITCYNQTKQTRVQKSTNSPFWNEVFFFNFFTSPAELFDQLITFGVYNSRKLRSDAFIGSFKCDIGMIYDEPNHSFINKWLLLSDPEDSMAGAKGYLKICATVLGPGDDAPPLNIMRNYWRSFKPQTQNDEEDIESNLLRPAGVMLRPASFVLRLYRAEDIPRMDSDFIQGVKQIFGSSDKKELVDPYFVFSFAGQSVKSKIVYNCENPEWNQELRLGLRFPSMCERLKFQMFDWDRVTESDPICSAFINTNYVSRSGADAMIQDADETRHATCVSIETAAFTSTGNLTPEAPLTSPRGFLPTFGPCFVNFYGSPREYSDLPDEYEDLNMGKGEGVAYRGRALVELQTVLGEVPETPVDEINNDDLLRVQKFMRRRKFKLHAAFLNATMISAVDAPVEFEVSIGNYGNKLDESVPPCSSTTQPTNAVFDGSYYYFLPWGDTKPCVVVDSHWEDISYRLETLNLLNGIIERLEANMERARTGLKANLSTPELAQLVITMVTQFCEDCRKPLPPIIEGQHVQNELDRHLRYYREVELQHLGREAGKLREEARDVNDALGEVEGYLAQLRNLAIEPQNSMPDVVIWMISGEKRIAYHRIPAYQVLWSSNPDYCGKLCGKLETISLRYPGSKAEKDDSWEIPALLRIKLWMGLERHEMEWHRMQTEGDLAVFAETYENQVTILGNWTNKGPTMTRPKYSDATGKCELQKDNFVPPSGWRWDGTWYISPELSMLYDKDAGHTQFLEDVYENLSRYPGGDWGESTIPWSDVTGDGCIARDEIELPEGWEWEEDWQVDLNRAVDEDGWEYTVEATLGGYGPVEKRYHMCKRRRWVRSRRLLKDVSKSHKEEKLAKAAAEGWEYAPLFNMKFHHKERKMDLVRRRRWHRKMVAESPNAPCFFQMEAKGRDSDSDSEESSKKKGGKDDDNEKRKAALAAPRMFLTCKTPNKYQLRAYIYQARDILAGDSNGLSDPFARVVFLNQSDVTERLEKTLCPTWDQTLIYETVEIHGDPQLIKQRPPEVIIEIFDHDTFGSAEFLGRSMTYPTVKLDPSDAHSSVLQWHKVMKGSQYGGELLAAFELILLDPRATHDNIQTMMDGKDLPFLPPKRGRIFIVPNGIRPVMQRTAIEVMTWGVRNMKKFQLASVTSPSVELEVGGHMVQSRVIRNTKKNPNFDDPLLFFDVMLPREELYMPPLNIRVRDNRQFGRKPLVGVHVIKSMEVYRHREGSGDDPLQVAIGNGGDGPSTGSGGQQPQGEHIIDMPSDEKTPILVKEAVVAGETSKQYATFPSDTVIPMDLTAHLSGVYHGVDIEKIQLHHRSPERPRKHRCDGKPAIMSPFVRPDTAQEPGTPVAGKLKKSQDLIKGLKFPKLAGITSPFFESESETFKHGDLFEEDIDWWSKFYASTGNQEDLDKCKQYLEQGYDKIQIFPGDLERVGEYGEFADFCHTFALARGKSLDEEESEIVGEFKGTFCVYPLPGDPTEALPPRVLANLPPSTPEDCVIRVYVIRATELQPNDPSGLADPYVSIKLGRKKVNNQDDYVPNSLNPVFGKMFEMKATLPMEKDLYIRIKDYDLLSTDDVIGETVIDLENRLLSKYRATTGLPQSYCVGGPCQWRESRKPRDMLQAFCEKQNISPGPIFSGNTCVKVGSRVFNLADFEVRLPSHKHLGPPDQRLALHVLNTLPASLGLPLVPEHVETRPLYNPLQPGIEQGKLQMWIDLFPLSLGVPGPAVDISPRKPSKYELRIVIWNTKDVILEEESITGEKMSDIYVKGWMSGIDDKQETDVHYRSLDGEGNFNWRFVFPFDYLPAEECIVVKRKEHFWSLDETECKQPANLIIQIWDNDKFSADDFLGTLELNLNKMPAPTKKSANCTLDKLPPSLDSQDGAKGSGSKLGGPKKVKMVSLFEQKRLRGYWPCYNDEKGTPELTGKVEMELELVAESEAKSKPVGQGRDEPNQHPMLEGPNRPETSFLWFTSPWKTMKHIIWRNYKWYFITGLIILLLVLFVILFIYSVPDAVVNKMFGT